MAPQTTNPTGQGRGGRGDVEWLLREADSTTSTPAAQPLTCRHCTHFLPLPRRSRCRWTGEHVKADWLASECWGFEPDTSTCEGGVL